MLQKNEFLTHLTGDLIPFWNGMRDFNRGGFYGGADFTGAIRADDPKSAVLQTRVLWFYSACYCTLHSEELLETARSQFRYLMEYLIDPADGAAWWLLNADGSVRSDVKHTYAQAFTLYAISRYFIASGDPEARAAADRLFALIESTFRDEWGYFDQFDLDRPGRKGWRTMNTLLHIVEAYAEYYTAVNTPEAREALKYSLVLVRDKAYNPALRRLECNFDPQMRPVGDMHSYGHDIEASWLVDRACEVLNDAEITGSLNQPLREIYLHACEKGLVNQGKEGMYYDCKEGNVNRIREWWVMSEAAVAMVHQHQKHNDPQAMELAENIWEFTRTSLISPAGEWYWGLDANGNLGSSNGLVGPWKCPYHNGRMCLEMLARL